MDLYQITLVGISTERKDLKKGGNGSPMPKKQGAGMMIKMGKAIMIKKGAGMTSMRSAFWSLVTTSLMPWSTMLRR